MNVSRKSTEAATALDIRGLGHSFGAKRALDGLDLSLNAGEFKVLLGPNGAGKTTLLSLLTRLFDGREGQITVFGKSLREDPQTVLSRMGVVFQQSTLDLDLTVQQNLNYHGALHGMSAGEIRARSETELARLNMTERAGERVRNLNGGHRRRVEIARALLHGPELLLLDEPTVGLDVPTRAAIVDHVHKLATEAGIAVLWTTHLIDEVREGDSVVILHQGRKRADGSCQKLLAETGARDIAEVFQKLTRDRAA